MSVYDTEQQLREILKAHKLWLDDPDQAGAARANLRGADLSRADLSGNDLSGADLRGADLSLANLRGANLMWAQLIMADLRGANLRGANLDLADLRGANLDGAIGILSPSNWLAATFEAVDMGYVVYKVIGETFFEAGDYLREVCHPDRGNRDGTGVNFATYAWCQKHLPGLAIWKCIIEWGDVPGVVVPFNPEGQARCERLRLVGVVS